MEKVCEFLKSAGTYYLATVEGDQLLQRMKQIVDQITQLPSQRTQSYVFSASLQIA